MLEETQKLMNSIHPSKKSGAFRHLKKIAAPHPSDISDAWRMHTHVSICMRPCSLPSFIIKN